MRACAFVRLVHVLLIKYITNDVLIIAQEVIYDKINCDVLIGVNVFKYPDSYFKKHRDEIKR